MKENHCHPTANVIEKQNRSLLVYSNNKYVCLNTEYLSRLFFYRVVRSVQKIFAFMRSHVSCSDECDPAVSVDELECVRCVCVCLCTSMLSNISKSVNLDAASSFWIELLNLTLDAQSHHK